MKSLPELVYKTTSSLALEWWATLEKLNEKQAALRKAFIEEMTELYGPSLRPDYNIPAPHVQTTRNIWVRGGFAYALDSGRDENPPVDSGWRLDRKERIWYPKLATKQGKELAKRLSSLNLVKLETRLPEVGIAQICFAESYLFRPGLRFDGQTKTLYSTWGSTSCAAEAEAAQTKVPEVIWERVKLSEYIAYLEGRGEEPSDG